MNDLQKAKNLILNDKLPIANRIRALFYLKNIHTVESAKILCESLSQKSVLLKHEAAYVLGQMRIPETLDTLKNLLADINEDEIARHEAGEALGNFLDPLVVEYLKNFVNDENINVKETCILAVKKYDDFLKRRYNKNNDNNIENTIYSNYKYDLLSSFDSYDPAYPLDNISITEAKNIFLDQKECIYKRYAALFLLRNIGTEECLDIIGQGFVDKSALFKHEVAFVFGQMRRKESVKYLKTTLENMNEHGMVRHESAEALGAIGSVEALDALKPFVTDGVDVVRESVKVALDIHSYENSNEAEYVRID